MKLARKILLGVTLGSVFFGVGLLIASIFGLNVFVGTWLKVLESLAIVVVAGAFSLNALNFMHKNRVIALVSFALHGALTALLFIVIWGGMDFVTSWFAQLVAVVAITTIFFNIIISNYLKLGKNHFVIQIITYAIIGVIDVVLMLEIFQVDVMQYILREFIIACLLTLGLLITLAVLGKKAPDEEAKIDGEKVVKLKQSEYDALLNRIKELEEKLKEKED